MKTKLLFLTCLSLTLNVYAEKKPDVKPSRGKASTVKPTVTIDTSASLKEQLAETLKLLDRENENLILLTESGVSSNARKVASANVAYLTELKDRIMKDLKKAKKGKLSDFSYRGHLQIRNESATNRQGTQGSRQSDQTFYRFRTYLSFSPNENMVFNFTPQATKGFGENENAGLTSHSTVTVYEANLDYKINDKLSAKIGRQELAYGEHLIIGSLPWANTARSFEGIKFNFQHALGSSDLMYSKVADNDTSLQANDDSNLVMFYNKMGFGPYAKELDFYILHRDDDETTLSTLEQEVNTIGFRLKGSAGMFFYRTENAIQNGSNLGDDAFQYNVEAGAKISRFKASFEYAVAGADYVQMYPTAHKFLGFADVLGRRNIKHMAVHFNGSIAKWLAMRVDYHNFKREDTTKGAYKLLGTTSWGTAGTSDDIGQEIDVVFTFKTSDKLKLQLGGAWFDPGEYMKAQQGNDKITQFTYVQLNAGF